jgi:hypothetical protein
MNILGLTTFNAIARPPIQFSPHIRSPILLHYRIP